MLESALGKHIKNHMSEKKQKNVLLVTSSLGNGHKIVAKNLYKSFKKSDKYKPHLVDILDTKSPIITKYMNKAYVRLTKFDLPWAVFYLFANTKFFLKFKDLSAYLPFKNTIKKVISNSKPDVIISTWPGLDMMFMKYKKPGTKFYSIITDIISIPKYWVNEGVDKYFVNDEKTKKCLISFGADKGKIVVTGYPLPEELLYNNEKDEDEIAKSFNFKNYKGKKTILCLSGVAPKTKFIKILKELNEVDDDLFLIIINFNNKTVKANINKIDFKHEVVHLDWTDKFYDLLAFSDVVVTKAGPGVVAEALFFNKYIALFHYIPGQEKGVKDYIIENKLGTYIENPEDIKEVVNFSDKERLHQSIRNFQEKNLVKNGAFWTTKNIENYFV